MSDQHGRDWTEEEKYSLLTVILRNSGVPSTSLFGIFRQFNVAPPWGDIPLPPGRSLNDCRQQFDSMWQTYQSQPSHRQPEPWQGPLPPSVTPALNIGPSHASHQTPLEPFGSRKRPFYPPERPSSYPRIQPRPPPTGGPFSSESGSPAPTSPGWVEAVPGKSTEPPRKRGRPSKAESERRKAEAEARGETYPPPRRRTSMSKLPATPSGAASATSDGSMVSPMQTAQTPEMPKHEQPLEAKDTSTGQANRASAPASGAPDTDPVRGIIRSQAHNQDRRLPLPHEFSTRTSSHDPIYSQTRALEHPYHILSTSQPEENPAQPTAGRPIIQYSEAAPSSGGGYLPISHSAGTTT